MKGFKWSSAQEVLDISIPAAGEMTVYTLMSIFDIMMIGNYGGNSALSAVGLSNEILFSLVNIVVQFGISVGITSLTARCIGAKRMKQAEEYAASGFALGLVLSLITSGIVFLNCSQLLKFAGARGEVLTKSIAYTKISILAIFINMLVNLADSVLRGYGNTYTPFLTSVIIACLKILLDACLIFGNILPQMGIVGASIASVAAQAAGFIYVIFYLQKISPLKIRWKYIINFKKTKDIITLSLPSSMEEAAYGISRLIGTFIIMYAGTTAFAANQVANTVETISIMPGVGFGAAATTLVGIKIGEKDIKKARQYAFSCAFWAVLISMIFFIIFLSIPHILIDAFIIDTESNALDLGTACLAVGALEQPTIAISYVMAGALKGTGDTKSPFYVSLFTSWAIRLPLMFYFIYYLKYSVVCVWWITVLQWAVDALLMYLSFTKIFKSRHHFFYRQKINLN